MKIPPKYNFTPTINSSLINIGSFRNLDLGKKIPKEISESLRRKSILGSSLFSARIEGNTLTRDEVSLGRQDVRDKRKREASNIDEIRDLRLLPRRLEILNIIREHKMVNFDFLQRRFLTVNPRTLRFDLKKLVDGKFIIKRGETRGVFYSPWN